ncbi:hypothetical protein Q5P01_017835 [Channa striata]|uniref:Uncharacterized protein n=1 Tax=Channa striata TaxID=64152 RepID=A0AA88SE90_CHASR|nr:hypothetical protein Q5P01_017835 [Channa striata]
MLVQYLVVRQVELSEQKQIRERVSRQKGQQVLIQMETNGEISEAGRYLRRQTHLSRRYEAAIKQNHCHTEMLVFDGQVGGTSHCSWSRCTLLIELVLWHFSESAEEEGGGGLSLGVGGKTQLRRTRHEPGLTVTLLQTHFTEEEQVKAEHAVEDAASDRRRLRQEKT